MKTKNKTKVKTKNKALKHGLGEKGQCDVLEQGSYLDEFGVGI